MHLPTRVTTVLGAVGCVLITASCSGRFSSDGLSGPDSLVLTLSPKTDTLVPGATLQLVARVSDDQGATRDQAVAWNSASAAIASVDAHGIVTAVAPGTARIVASAGTISDSVTIVVRANSALTVEPSIISIPLGGDLQLSVGGPIGTAASHAGESVRWTSSNESVATVNPHGFVSTIGVGDVTLSAQIGTERGSAVVSVKPNAVASIRITPANSSINLTATQQLDAVLLDDNGRELPSARVNWSSSDNAIATVSDDGVVTGNAEGFVVVTARLNGKRATATVNVLAVPVALVEVWAPASAVAIGQTLQASATLKDASGNVVSGRTIAWQSSNPALATVTSTGVVTGIAPGQVTISAIAEGKVGRLPLASISTTVASVAVTPAKGSATRGQTAQLKAEARDADGQLIADRTFNWRSSAPSVATVSSSGLLMAVTVGTTTITATTTDGVSGTGEFTVTSVPVASVSVLPATVQLALGGSAQLSAGGTDATGASLAQRVAQWSSSNPTIATVSSSGLVTAVGAGGTTITATIDGISAAAQVGVAAPPPAAVASITITLNSPAISTGQSTQAVATLRDANGNTLTGRPITWASTDPQLATVSATGLIAGIAAGTATISASAEGQTGVTSITVSLPAPAPVASIALSAPSASLTVGQTTQMTIVLRDSLGHSLSGRTIVWQSTNPAAATVTANGVVTGIGAGPTTIRATSEGVSATFGISVTAPVTAPLPVSTITVTAPQTSPTAGQIVQAGAVARDAAGAVLPNAPLSWSSTNSSVLTVSGSGLVAAVAAGSAQVRVTSGSAVGTLSMNVLSAPLQPPPTGAQEPELPRATVNVTMPAVTGRSISVGAGGDLQGALNAAQPGDEVVLAAGAVFTGNYTLPVKGGSGWVVVRTSGALPAPGTRVTPSNASQMAKIITPKDNPALRAEDGASGWRLVGLEVGAASGLTVTYTLVSFGDGDETSLAQVPRRLVLDRSYVHGHDQLDVRRGVGLQCADCAVVDSWISEIHSAFDAAAVWGWNGPGPMLIENNRLEGSGENVMFGGADPRIPGVQPADITIRHNHIIKPLAWKGRWLAKNLVEFKSGVRVLMEGNVLENSWADGQAGFAAVWWSVNQDGSAPWVVTSDVTFRRNLVRNVAAGFQMSAYLREGNPAMTRVAIRDNLFVGVGAAGLGTPGPLYQLDKPVSHIWIEHNTGFSPLSSLYFVGAPLPGGVTGLVVRDNILGDGSYNLFGSAGQGAAGWNQYAGAGSAFAGNVVVRPNGITYPPGNFTAPDLASVGFASWWSDPRLASSPFSGRATDATDPGVSQSRLVAATTGAEAGTSSAASLAARSQSLATLSR